jgi:hypothetical protein
LLVSLFGIGCASETSPQGPLPDLGKADGFSTEVCGVAFQAFERRGVGEIGELDTDPRKKANEVAADLNLARDCEREIDTCMVPKYFVNEDETAILVEISNSEIVGARLVFEDFELAAEEVRGECREPLDGCAALDDDMAQCVSAQLRGDGLEHVDVIACLEDDVLELIDCCEASGDFAFCHHVEPPLNVELDMSFLSTPEGIAVGTHPEFVGESFFGHFEFTGITDDERFTPYVLTETLRFIVGAHEEFCSTIPLYGAMEFEENTSLASFVSFLRNGTDSWDTRMSEDQIVALEAFLDEQGGDDNVAVFFGRTKVEDRCGFSETSYNLIWNKATNDVLYLGLHPLDGV